MADDTTNMSIVETCAAQTRNGERCGAQKMRGSEYCFFHAPELVDLRADARRRGGLARHGPRGEAGEYDISSPQDVLQVLTDAINDVSALGNTAGRAKAIGYLAQIILKGFEVTELDGRLKALEDKIYNKK
jgi:hypothetical protein